jgi:DNA-binding transcriptional regulator YiaG|tara:strand:- start:227 stop:448 length:222 start_codon:yes stop_codon:yes gene_type:complete
MKTATINWTPERIKKLRLVTRTTQTAFAERVGVGRSAISAWEADTKSPSLTNQAILDKLASWEGLTARILDED